MKKRVPEHLFPVRQGPRTALLCLLAASGYAAVGQSPALDLSDLSLDQLAHAEVYTASRHLQSIDQAPASVTLITAKDIRDHGYRTLADVLSTVRGFFVTNDRNYSSVGVRGFARPGDFNTRVLLLVDGHRLNDNVYDEAMLGTEFPVNVDLIERIEIIRGPVSSLYGSNALFGVVNIFTKKGAALAGAEISASASSFNSKLARFSYGRKLGELEFAFSASFSKSRGHNTLYFPAYDDPSTNNGIASHADDDRADGGLATISFHDLTLRGVFGTREKGIPTGAYYTFFNHSGTRTTDTHGYLDLQYEHKFGASWNVLGRVAVDRYGYHGTYIYASETDANQFSPENDFGDGRWWGTEWGVSRSVGRNRVVAGVEFRDNYRQNQHTYTLNPFHLDFDKPFASYIAGVYVQDEVVLSDHLRLNAGLRYDYYSSTQASTDPRVALIYRPRPTSTIKLTYGEAFRAPNVYEKYCIVIPNVANENLNPEKARSAEAVWEEQLAKGISLSTSLYETRVSGLITQAAQADGSQIFLNLQSVRSHGLEVELAGEFKDGPAWQASYGFQETKDNDTQAFLTSSPRTLGKFQVTQKIPRSSLSASLNAQYRSRLATRSGDFVSPFTIVNATLLGRHVGKHGEVSASIYNLLDKQYSDPVSAVQNQESIHGDGRSFRVQMIWHTGGR